MKNLIYSLLFLISFSSYSQDLYWYDVILDIKNQNSKDFENSVDKFYSNIDFWCNNDFFKYCYEGAKFQGDPYIKLC